MNAHPLYFQAVPTRQYLDLPTPLVRFFPPVRAPWWMRFVAPLRTVAGRVLRLLLGGAGVAAAMYALAWVFAGLPL